MRTSHLLRAGAVLSALLVPAASSAQQPPDSAAFLIRLGHDTTVVERYVRTADRITAEAVQRSPSTQLHSLVLELAPDGGVRRAEWTVRRPGMAEPVFRRVVAFQGDSATVETVQGGTTRSERVAAADAIPIMGPFYTPYELALMRAAGATERLEVPLLTGGGSIAAIPIERVGGDSVALSNQFGEPMTARVDATGRLLSLGTPAFTTVERLPWVDLDALARDFAARDETGRGMGPLSPRETSRTMVDGATVWVDYSRPGKRGRPVWGELVPWGEVWRMGANDAAHLATDRRLELGGLTLEAGAYTLFLEPTPEEWTLIVNRATGISGLERDPAMDVGRVALRTEPLEQPVEAFTLRVEDSADGGLLELLWDERRAWVSFSVR